MTTRVLASRATPRDLAGIRVALDSVPELAEQLSADGLESLLEGLSPVPEVRDLIAEAIVDDPRLNSAVEG